MTSKALRTIIGLAFIAVIGFALTACNNEAERTADTSNINNTTNATSETSSNANNASDTSTSATTGEITVITREDGSGTRGAFVEIVDITIEGNDNITVEAVVAPGTSVMMTNVAENPQAIGYASTGVALADDRVRVLNVDGVAPTVENMLSGTYAIQRPFIIGYNTDEGLSPLAQDFIDFIFSTQGQEVVAGRGYVPFVPTGAPEYTPSGQSGRIVVNGSSSVYSLMQHLSAAYRELNPDVEIDIHGAGTGHGISAVRDGLADIAMSSRDLRESELEFMSPLTIAIDGIAVIAHPSNPLEGLSLQQVRDIFLGELTRWEAIANE